MSDERWSAERILDVMSTVLMVQLAAIAVLSKEDREKLENEVYAILERASGWTRTEIAFELDREACRSIGREEDLGG